MTRFIKLPKSLTNDTSFDLLNLNGFGELFQITSFTVSGISRMVATYLSCNTEDESLTEIIITLDGDLTTQEEKTLVNNAWKAVKSACQNPGSIPVLEIPGDRVVTSIQLSQPTP
tara:strand:- start:3489 stop:3833 length:345 start_codon:yes stop_codon:yes gene_type:complete